MINLKDKKKKPKFSGEKTEDTTAYPEFIPSFDQWTTSENQKKTVAHLENVSKINKPTDIKRHER